MIAGFFGLRAMVHLLSDGFTNKVHLMIYMLSAWVRDDRQRNSWANTPMVILLGAVHADAQDAGFIHQQLTEGGILHNISALMTSTTSDGAAVNIPIDGDYVDGGSNLASLL